MEQMMLMYFRIIFSLEIVYALVYLLSMVTLQSLIGKGDYAEEKTDRRTHEHSSLTRSSSLDCGN